MGMAPTIFDGQARCAWHFFILFCKLISTQTDVAHDEWGHPPSYHVSICTDAMREGTPFSLCFCPQRCNEGDTPSRCVSVHIDATRRGSPLLSMFLFTQTPLFNVTEEG
jgi:hypothetical protein